MAELDLHNLTIRRGARTLLRGLDLRLQTGQCWALLGPNGAGKSSLLHALAALVPVDSGTVTLDGTALHAIARTRLARRLGLLLQQHHDPFPSSVLAAALIGRHPHLGRWESESEEDFAITRAALAEVDLSGLEERLVETLSGGERQRLAIATLLAQQSEILLLDEPANHLDLRHQHSLLGHFAELGKHDKLVVMALHDPNQAVRYASHALLLDGNGGWQAGESREMLQAARLSKLYAVSMEHVESAAGRFFIPGGN